MFGPSKPLNMFERLSIVEYLNDFIEGAFTVTFFLWIFNCPEF